MLDLGLIFFDTAHIQPCALLRYGPLYKPPASCLHMAALLDTKKPGRGRLKRFKSAATGQA
jgi:hypothetical protein